jgi:hypothetical protein
VIGGSLVLGFHTAYSFPAEVLFLDHVSMVYHSYLVVQHDLRNLVMVYITFCSLRPSTLVNRAQSIAKGTESFDRLSKCNLPSISPQYIAQERQSFYSWSKSSISKLPSARSCRSDEGLEYQEPTGFTLANESYEHPLHSFQI